MQDSDPQKHRFLPHRHLYLRFMFFFQILKSMIVSHFLKLTSALTLTNKLSIDPRLERCRFENTLKSDRDLR
jgi:hypothetical protein